MVTFIDNKKNNLSINISVIIFLILLIFVIQNLSNLFLKNQTFDLHNREIVKIAAKYSNLKPYFLSCKEKETDCTKYSIEEKFFDNKKYYNITRFLNAKKSYYAYFENGENEGFKKGEIEFKIFLDKEIKEGYLSILGDPSRNPKNINLSFFSQNKKNQKTIFQKNDKNKRIFHIPFKLNDSFDAINISISGNFDPNSTNAIVDFYVHEKKEKINYSFFFFPQRSYLNYFLVPLFFVCLFIFFGNVVKKKSVKTNTLSLYFCGILLSCIVGIFFIFNHFFAYLILFLLFILATLKSPHIICGNVKLYQFFSCLLFFFFTSNFLFYYNDELFQSPSFYDFLYDYEKSAPLSEPFHPFYLPNDWDYHLPWATVKFFIHNLKINDFEYKQLFGPHNPFDRALLLPLLGVLVTKIFDEKYFLFHCLIINFIFINFLIIHKLLSFFKIFNIHKKNLLILLLLINPFFLWINLALSIKLVGLTFSLGAILYLYLYLKNKKIVVFLFSSFLFGLSILTHISFAPTIILFFIILYKNKNYFNSISKYTLLPAISLITYFILQFQFSDFLLFKNVIFFETSEKSLELYGKNLLENSNILLNKFYNFKGLFFKYGHPTIKIPYGIYEVTLYGLPTITFFIFYILGFKNSSLKKEYFGPLVTIFIYIIIISTYYICGIFLAVLLSSIFIILLSYINFFFIVRNNVFLKMLVIFLYLFEVTNYLFNSNKFEHIFKNIGNPNLINNNLTFILLLYIVLIFLFLILISKNDQERKFKE
jgi:hypothetical protein